MADATRRHEDRKRPRVSDEAVTSAILQQTGDQGREGSVGPGDVARALAPQDWQALLPRIRQAAVVLARQGRLEILRKGKPADPASFKGVYRLRIAAGTPADGDV